MFIAIEGVDGSGKTLQSKLLMERLQGTRFKFPDADTRLGRLIYGHLRKEWAADHVKVNESSEPYLDAMVFQCLQTANRLEKQIPIIHAKQRGHVIADRYFASGLVYGAVITGIASGSRGCESQARTCSRLRSRRIRPSEARGAPLAPDRRLRRIHREP